MLYACDRAGTPIRLSLAAQRAPSSNLGRITFLCSIRGPGRK